MEVTILVIAMVLVVAMVVLGLTEIMRKDKELVEWQRAYAEIATELELVRLGVSK